jgi:hypothetical protein
MPVLFWVDAVALVVSTVLACALILTVLGSGPRRQPNRHFAFFALGEAAWAVPALLLRGSLWLGTGNTLLLAELTSLGFVLQSIALLSFSARYAGHRTIWADLAALAGLAATGALAAALFSGRIVLAVSLWPNGSVVSVFSPLGYLAALLPAGFVLASLVVLWRQRRRAGAPNLALSVLVFFAGWVFGGVLEFPFPILSITTTASLLLMGYGLVSRQLLNPLRERAARLELLSQIGRSVATLQGEEVLRESVQRIRATFGFHNVSVLLVEGEWLVLRAASLPAAGGEVAPARRRRRDQRLGSGARYSRAGGGRQS